VTQDLLDHCRPPVSERASLTDEGEVGGVGNAMCVDATVHLITVKVGKALNLVREFRVGGEGGYCGVEE
jgi:hypothetical protein